MFLTLFWPKRKEKFPQFPLLLLTISLKISFSFSFCHCSLRETSKFYLFPGARVLNASFTKIGLQRFCISVLNLPLVTNAVLCVIMKEWKRERERRRKMSVSKKALVSSLRPHCAISKRLCSVLAEWDLCFDSLNDRHFRSFFQLVQVFSLLFFFNFREFSCFLFYFSDSSCSFYRLQLTWRGIGPSDVKSPRPLCEILLKLFLKCCDFSYCSSSLLRSKTFCSFYFILCRDSLL